MKALWGLAATPFLLFAAAQPDLVMDAMRTELKRATTLTLNQLDKPYFVSYSVDDYHSWSANATLGGLLSSNSNTYRVPSVRVRVGDYKFDNSNFAGGGMGGARYDLRSFPLDDDPLVIRQYLWLATDSAYKGGLQSIARKRAALRSVTVNDQLPDFAPAPPVTIIRDYTPARFDYKDWNDRVRLRVQSLHRLPRPSDFTRGIQRDRWRASLHQQRGHRSAHSGRHRIGADPGLGTGLRRHDRARFRSLLHARYRKDVSGAGTHEGGSRCRRYGDEDRRRAHGRKLHGSDSVQGVAAAQIMAEVLGRNLHISRKSVAGRGMPSQAAVTELEGRRGVRIMPEFFDVTDDPTLPLFGHEEVDDEGVPEKPVSLVEKGVLRDFLRTASLSADTAIRTARPSQRRTAHAYQSHRESPRDQFAVGSQKEDDRPLPAEGTGLRDRDPAHGFPLDGSGG